MRKSKRLEEKTNLVKKIKGEIEIMEAPNEVGLDKLKQFRDDITQFIRDRPPKNPTPEWLKYSLDCINIEIEEAIKDNDFIENDMASNRDEDATYEPDEDEDYDDEDFMSEDEEEIYMDESDGEWPLSPNPSPESK
jgi:hypothetical protein